MSPLSSAPRRMASASAVATAREVVDSHRHADAGELFGIAELCRAFGITLRTIRFYEDKACSARGA